MWKCGNKKTDVIQLTLTLKMTTTQVVEMSVTVNNNSPIQDYVHPGDQTLLLKNKEVAHKLQGSVSLMFLPHFDIFCDLSLNRPMATWNLFVLYRMIGTVLQPIHLVHVSALYWWLFKDLLKFRHFLSPRCYFCLCLFFSALSYLYTVSFEKFSASLLAQLSRNMVKMFCKTVSLL